MSSFWIPDKLPSLNELVRAKGSFAGGKGKRWNGYNALKQRYQSEIGAILSRDKPAPLDRAFITFAWHEATWRRDPDNVAAGGRKLILDTLVKAGVLPDDGPRHVSGWTDTFVYGAEEQGVMVTLRPADG
jgi:hypothetical protein